MAFKGMDQRFQAQMDQLYAKGSTTDGSQNQPFLEYKPNNPNRNETASDSRFFPLGSIKRDAIRIGRFLKSIDGLQFLVKQQTLQSGNVFTETRLLNPLFVIGNVQPYRRIRRPLDVPAANTPSGDQTQMSPGSLGQVGGAGRLQKNTKASVLAAVTGQGANGGLLSFLDPTRLLGNIGNAFGVGSSAGSLGINERPELDVAGEYFSIQIWKGFQKYQKPVGFLDQAGSALRQGNFIGAIKAAGSALGNFLFGSIRRITPTWAPDDRDNANNTLVNGSRYFITSDVAADRYLQNSIQYGSVSTPYLSRNPYILNGGPIAGVPGASFAAPQSTGNSTKQQTTQARTGGGFWSDLVNGFTSAFGNSFQTNFANTLQQKLTQTIASSGINATNPFNSTLSDNSGEDNMLFPSLALRQRYENDVRMDFIKTQLANQRQAQKDYWSNNQTITGFVGGIKPGDDLNPDPYQKVRFAGGMYLQDNLNSIGIIPDDEKSVSQNTKAAIASVGQDLINVFFYDYVNKNTIPFRAFISNITENVTPDVSDTRYIGRIERNVVYVGVSREISFTLRAYAFSEWDLDNIWTKINYVTGLCYPSKYAEGFMVPPFVKLTIGDLYRDQPGYFKAVSHQIEEDASWEITPGSQAPFGVSMNITFCVIEKTQVTTKSNFYPVGT